MSEREGQVEFLADRVETERVRRANQLAYAQGRREADVDAHLRSHENRLNAINGSIEKHARNAAKLEATMDKRCDAIEDKLDELLTAHATQTAVEADRVAQVKTANDKQISKRNYWLGVIGVVLTGIGIILAVLIGTHVI
jgi:chromosome segregation ATPase